MRRLSSFIVSAFLAIAAPGVASAQGGWHGAPSVHGYHGGPRYVAPAPRYGYGGPRYVAPAPRYGYGGPRYVTPAPNYFARPYVHSRVFVPGYWGYRGGARIWIGGAWAFPPYDGWIWIGPQWQWNGYSWVWQEGYWAPPY